VVVVHKTDSEVDHSTHSAVVGNTAVAEAEDLADLQHNSLDEIAAEVVRVVDSLDSEYWVRAFAKLGSGRYNLVNSKLQS
jgi:hypothetical protein